MRIAWVLYGDLTQRTGGTIYDAEVVAGLRRAGDEVHVISLPPGGGLRASLRGGLALARELRALAPDIVVGDELCFRELAVAFQRLGAGRMDRVLLVHHLTAWETELRPMRRRVLGVVEHFAMRASDAIVTTSETTRRRLLAEGVRRPVTVVLPGADRLVVKSTRAGERGDEREGDVQLVFVGSIVARKRVLDLVRAFARGAHVRGRLVLVGSTARDEAYVAEIRALVARLGVGARVVVTGELDEPGVAHALGKADVLVMPSSLEGYGIAATEAIHAGIPVIAARAQGIEEALAACPDACVFAEDERALGIALERFATAPALRRLMRAAARQAAPRMPTWTSCASRFRSALIDVLAANGRGHESLVA